MSPRLWWLGDMAHGPPEYRWARIPVRTAWRPGREHWLLARRSISDPAEMAYYASYGSRRSGVADLAWITGSRWHVEMVFRNWQRAMRRRVMLAARSGSRLRCR
jgi:hypothetical protein